MPRNQPKPLRPEEYQQTLRDMRTLAGAFNDDVEVTVTYEKRNGRMSSSHGKVEDFVGKAGFDTFSVQIIDLSKTPPIRTINMVGIKSIEF